jgi:hypothetical protein
MKLKGADKFWASDAHSEKGQKGLYEPVSGNIFNL